MDLIIARNLSHQILMEHNRLWGHNTHNVSFSTILLVQSKN